MAKDRLYFVEMQKKALATTSAHFLFMEGRHWMHTSCV